MFISVSRTSSPCIYMSDFYMAGFSQVFLNAALSLLFDYGDTMIRKAVLPERSYCHFPNTEDSTEHLVVDRNCLCASRARSKALSFFQLCLPSVVLVISLLICHHRWSLLFTCFLFLHYLLSDFSCDDINTRQASVVMDNYRMRVLKNFPVRNSPSVS